MASAATKQGAACPRRVSKDKTDKTWLKCSCGHNKTQTRLSWPWRVDWIHGARVSGDRRAWVSDDPAGFSQRRSGGLESAAIRRARVSGGLAGIESEGRALSQRWAGGHWVRGGPAGIESEAGQWPLSQRQAGGVISRERRAWGSGNPGTREPAGGLGIATAGGGYLPQSAGMRARGQRTRLPRETKHRKKTKTRKKRTKQNEVKGRHLRLGLVFCHGAHRGRKLKS